MEYGIHESDFKGLGMRMFLRMKAKRSLIVSPIRTSGVPLR
eukprot:SAG11_NODE_281_length_11257_cov_45.949633_7_plen_41_part_00